MTARFYSPHSHRSRTASPHSGPLPWGEGELRTAYSAIGSQGMPERHQPIKSRSIAVPSPWGEGQGEGESR